MATIQEKVEALAIEIAARELATDIVHAFRESVIIAASGRPTPLPDIRSKNKKPPAQYEHGGTYIQTQLSSRNTSGVTGVGSSHDTRVPWESRMMYHGQDVRIKTYTFEEAVFTRLALEQHFGKVNDYEGSVAEWVARDIGVDIQQLINGALSQK